ncbi:hypothetical protein P7L53_06865 [Thermoleptolyngbya sichuanensis XZ-Cy5]|uniref:hypothetical protein n=1 Tax=Thermoleptolyngbya sichuanensis TaxID=2885951 RepID=UPI00240D50A7|nr:hypothetical protein [Thermoleptolyngbya sichuanensis]MDG2615964.1 hypothetical protein [Thermoleptolyngbya sichuanensis XZ-Cy5]
MCRAAGHEEPGTMVYFDTGSTLLGEKLASLGFTEAAEQAGWERSGAIARTGLDQDLPI